MIKSLLDADDAGEKVLDREFIERKVDGFEGLKNHIAGMDSNELLKDIGMSREALQPLVDKIKQTQKIVVCWAMGLTQHENAVVTIQEFVNLLLIKGAVV